MEVKNKWGRTADMSKREEARESGMTNGASFQTRRHVNEGAEKHLDIYYPVLDHGFIAMVDYMGGDATIDRAARCSYGAGTRKTREVAGLIDYLVRNRHTSPLEMAEVTWHMRLPIFVARQLIRHRTANVNEYSGRYSEMLDFVYQPLPERLGKQSKTNKQGTSVVPLNDEQKTAVTSMLREDAERCRNHYNEFLTPEMDLSRELARIGLGVNVYTEWYWKLDMKNTLHFLSLRNDPHAQWEIREYAKIMQNILTDAFPHLMWSFVQHQQDATLLGHDECRLVRSIMEGKAHETTDILQDVPERQWVAEVRPKLEKLFPVRMMEGIDATRKAALEKEKE